MNEILTTINLPSFHAAVVMAFILVLAITYQVLTHSMYSDKTLVKVGYLITLFMLGTYLTYVWIAPDPVYYQYGIMFPQTETLSEMVTVSAVAALILSYIGGKVYHDFSLR